MVLKYCDWAANVECPAASAPPPAAASPSPAPASPSPSPSPVVPSPTPSPSPAPVAPSPSPSPAPSTGCTTTTFCAGKADGLYANPCDAQCATYVQCWNAGRSSAVKPCGAGLVFNPTRQYCDWPANYACPSGSAPTPAPPAPTPSPSPAPPAPTPTPTPSPTPTPTPSPSPAPPAPAPAPAPANPLLPTQKLVVAYYQTWSSPWAGTGANLDLAKTPAHVNVVVISFAKPDCTYAKGSLSFLGTGLDFSSDGAVVRDAIRTLKANNPGTRVLLAVGGATYTNFAALNMQCVKDIVTDFGMDGADIDYEPASPNCQRLAGGTGVKCATDAESVEVSDKFRAAMPKGQYILSTASWHVGCYGVGQWANSLPTFSQYFGVNLAMAKSASGGSLDLINIMAYDAGGPASPAGNPTGFNWRESFLSTRAAWPNAAVALGVEVPAEAWGGFASDEADVRARADFVVQNGGSGLMVWSLQKPGTPSAKTIASIACTKFDTCSSAPWPFSGSARR
jgi:chitinase